MSKRKNEPDTGYRVRQELRKGSRTSPHQDSRTKRARTRQAGTRHAINDSRGGSFFFARRFSRPTLAH